MKKRVCILGLFLISMLALAGCGQAIDPDAEARESAKEQQYLMTGEQTAMGLLQELSQLHAEGGLEELLGQTDEIDALIGNFTSGMQDVGKVVDMGEPESKVDGKTVIVDIPITGDKLDPDGNARTATVEMIVPVDGSMPDLAVNPKYTTGELMTKAGLNTLLGMGVTFAILILISLIISSFTLIGKIGQKPKSKDAAPADTGVDNAVRQIVAGEEQADDTELIAVISAAIAAYEADNGYVSADGVVIRSIRKINKSKWQNA